MLQTNPSEAAFETRMLRLFDVYESVGYNGAGTVLFTGYYSPEFPASRRRTTRFSSPLYRRPNNLVTDQSECRPGGPYGAL